MGSDRVMNVLLMILAGWAFMAIVMALLWLVQKRTGDAGIVDIAWGMGVAILAAFFCWMTDDGLVLRRVIIAVLTILWAIRLSGYVLIRVLRMPEDGRYKTLKENWGSSSQQNLFLFYQFQAFGSVLFALPMLIAAHNPEPFGLIDVLAILVWCIAIGGESIADRQLHRFRTDSDNRGKVCRNGLWGWSRHPNYFFEWVHWWTYVLFAILAPFGWLTVLFPMAMLYFILFKTGIPPTEQQSIKSRGDAYREYQRTTSAFFPFPPKS
jgi:steroid 5-alpha reductase family enzyme